MWKNKRAKHEYTIEATKEAGVVLEGDEVKSIRQNGVSLGGCYAVLQGGEFWLLNLSVERYKFSAGFIGKGETQRPKKLLLKANEVRKWIGSAKDKGKTTIPLSAYFNQRGFFKVEIALCSGKTKHDKRRSEREKERRRESEYVDSIKRQEREV